MKGFLKRWLFFFACGTLLCGCQTVSHLPQYEQFIGRESVLDREYYLYEVHNWPTSSYKLRGDKFSDDPTFNWKFIATLPAGTAVNVLKVQRIYVEDGCDILYATVYVPELKGKIEFTYAIGHLPFVNDGRQKLNWILKGN
jgi:hypothetical protein